MCFDRNINGNRDVKFLIGIIGHCTDQRKLLKHVRFMQDLPIKQDFTIPKMINRLPGLNQKTAVLFVNKRK